MEALVGLFILGLVLVLVFGSLGGLIASMQLQKLKTRLTEAEKDLYRALNRIVALEEKIAQGAETKSERGDRMATGVQTEASPETATVPPPIPVSMSETRSVSGALQAPVTGDSDQQFEARPISPEGLHAMASAALPLSSHDLQELADEACAASAPSPEAMAVPVVPVVPPGGEHREAAAGDLSPFKLPSLKLPSLQLEQTLGTKWFVWIGVVLMVIGGGYFLKYAYDNNWIEAKGRLAIGTLFSVGALALGHYCWRQGWRFLFQGMTGGGLAGLYGCVYFSMQVYHLASPGLAMTLATGVTLLAIALSVAHDAMPVAILGLIGGFLSPVLLSTGENHPYGLFTYVFILNLVALGTAYYRQWRVLDSLAFAATILMYQGWFLKFFHAPDQPSQLTPALLYTSVFYLQFLLIPMIHSLVRRIPSRPEGLALLALNAVQSLYGYYQILFVDYRQALGVVVLLQAMLIFALYRVYAMRLRDDARTMESLLVIGLALTVLAVPIQLKLYAVALAWAAQGVLFVYLGGRFNRVLLRVSGAMVLILAVFRLLGELPLHTLPFTPIVNVPFCSWAAVIAALGVSAGLLARDRQWPSAREMAGILGVSAYASGCLLLSMETERCFHLKVFGDTAPGGFESALTTLWSLIPVLSILAFRKWPEKLVGVCGLVAYGLGILFFLGGLTSFLDGTRGPVLNVDLGARFLWVASLSLGTWVMGRNTTRWPSSRELVGTMGVLAYVFGCLLLSLEVKRCFDHRMFDPSNGAFMTTLMALWTVIPALSAWVLLKWREKIVAGCVIAAYGVGGFFFLVGLGEYSNWSVFPVLNLNFGVRLLWVGALWWAGRVAWKLEEKTLRYVGKIAGHVSLAILLAIELVRMGTKDAYLPERMAVSLISAVWALQALGLIVDGLVRRMRPVRILGFLLFAITLVKIFLIDMMELEKVYRIISFFGTGVVLVVAGYCYQRFGAVLLREDQETGEEPGLNAAASGALEARKEPGGEEKP